MHALMRSHVCNDPETGSAVGYFLARRKYRFEGLERFEAYFLTCWYCGELLHTAEELRARDDPKDQPQTAM
jgi:hypothetical protein